ncbi:MAG TPA: DUF5947 family protein [Terriglobales bacterium]|jgi:hypothetical protein|nr:DUF5947 family protein [Terriglobales bacterium]
MATKQPPSLESAFGVLRQFARPRRPAERCELCSTEIHLEHPHLLEPKARKLVCSCDACALLFSGQAKARYKRVPKLSRLLANFEITNAQWESLMIPINMAFFFRSSPEARVVAMYPSPAGATESLLSLESWDEIARGNPEIEKMEPDVEALLANRIGHARELGSAEYYLLPIDHCFKLVGIIRSQWRGFSGGTEVWQQIAGFFAQLRKQATVLGRTGNA